MKRRIQLLYIGLAGSVVIAAFGCADAPPADQQASSTGVAPPPVVLELPAVEPPTETDNANTPPGADENTESVVAEVGFGKKGHYDSNDYISVTVGTQFRVQERITLLRITQALRQYKAINGKFPQKDEVFWDEIIKANSIQIPELPAGEMFLYDPDLAKETNAEQSLRKLVPKKP